MKHRQRARKFGRTTDVRRAFIKSLLVALAVRHRINTTEARAKEIRPKMEKLLTKAKSAINAEAPRALALRRQIVSETSPKIAKMLIDKIAPKYKERSGGYIRIVKTGVRRSDGARLAIIEFV